MTEEKLRSDLMSLYIKLSNTAYNSKYRYEREIKKEAVELLRRLIEKNGIEIKTNRARKMFSEEKIEDTRIDIDKVIEHLKILKRYLIKAAEASKWDYQKKHRMEAVEEIDKLLTTNN